MKGTKFRGNLANKVGRSFEIGSQIFPDFVQVQTVTGYFLEN